MPGTIGAGTQDQEAYPDYRFGKPIAEVVPSSPEKDHSDWLGSMTDAMDIVGDIVSPVSDEDDWEALRD